MIYPKLDALATLLSTLDTQGLHRSRTTVESASHGHMLVEGRRLLTFNSNDYLGLASHPQVVEALREGASLYGAGSGASHLISGHSQAHDRLEESLATFLSPYLPSARALYFSTGYMANLGLLSALAGTAAGDICFFSDKLNHASLIDGIRLSREPFQIYAHADMADLSLKLSACQTGTKVVVTDGVFSMDGDIAPLPELLRLCEQHGAWLLVDDAHGFGVLGDTGAGVLQHFNLSSPQLIYMGTLGKAAGVSGAFVAAHEHLIEWLVQRSRPYIYTTAAAPALAHALLTSLRIIQSEEGQQLRTHLKSLIQQLSTAPVPASWQRLPSITPIQPMVLGSNEQVLKASAELNTQGIWISAIRAPTVPINTARLRITLSAVHTTQDVDHLVQALAQTSPI
ncbi:MAG: 8-amino-7-oxononanoate synthase [Burkholderiales bacterium]|nr:8-amino-7-oxononanoate synthase [Burkholderiales bacterium]